MYHTREDDHRTGPDRGCDSEGEEGGGGVKEGRDGGRRKGERGVGGGRMREGGRSFPFCL